MKSNILDLDMLEDWLKTRSLAVVHIYRDHCSVCHAVLPQLESLLQRYPGVDLGLINAEDIPEIAGQWNVFTVPVDIIFYEGKEKHREGRFIHFEQFEKQLSRIYESIHS